MSATELLLIDLSGIGHMIWHTDTSNPDPSRVSTQTIARVRALAAQHPHAAICCDDGKSFRADIDPTYKANRDTENRAPLRHQMDLACETLTRDGFIVWRVKGFEADDIIATATTEALKMDPDVSVLIVSSDKDLLQLVSERVRVKSLVTGLEAGPEQVLAKFKVLPQQVHDYLCLVGDTSDNIVGAKGIGGVTAAKLLNEHGAIANIYAVMDRGVVPGLTLNVRASLTEFRARWPTVAQLIALRTDAPIQLADIAVERTAPPMDGEMAEPFKQGDDSNDAPLPWTEQDERDKFNAVMHAASAPRELDQNESLAALSGAVERVKARLEDDPAAVQKRQMEQNRAEMERYAKQSGAVAPAGYAGPVDFSQQLEPRSMPEAKQLAQMMFESRLFSAYGTPQAVLATVLAGRELGIPAMASLRAFHVIEGKPTMSAGTIQSLVLKSGKAQYFRCSERTAERATFVTKRGDDPEMALSYTIEEGRRAWPKDDAAFLKSGWGRNPADMLVARASSKLARLVYPDVVSGLYAPEEME